MSLSILDFGMIGAYLLITLFIGIRYSSVASQNTSEFFLSGRKQPWWLAGTGMVATTFAADTPLAITGFVAKNGIAGNWVWWSSVFGGMLTVFFFARLWRRAQILTDLEFIELRYSGKAAKFLRGFKAVYFGLFLNIIIVGWVNLAMLKIITIMLPELHAELAIVFCVGLTALYSGLAGLWGVTVTDLIQFTISMIGCVILAVLAVQSPTIQNQGGFLEALPKWMFHFLPQVTESTTETTLGSALQLTVYSFIAFVGIQWWASWYPGSEPGGGGYIAQRMMSAKDEKHSLLATLWFIVAHYCIRPWPWIIVGLASVAMFPNLPVGEKEDGFIHVMQAVLPSGLKGLLLAAFLAAYMSTLSTHLNWGTSYLLNDFYKRFLKPEADENHFVLMSKLFTVAIAIISLLVTFYVLDTITGAWEFLLECGAGTGFVLILRWFWWRLNAWSEITSMVAPFIAYSVIYFFTEIIFPESLFFIVGFTIICTLAVTFLTKPDSMTHLKAFYQKTRVGGVLWKKVSKELPDVQSDSGFLRLFFDWTLGIVLVYAFLFGVGKIIFGELLLGIFLLFVGILSGVLIYFDFEKRGWIELD